MIRMNPFRASLALAAMLAMSVPALAQDDSDKKDKKNDGQSQAKKDEARELKAFDLEHRKPQEIQQILALRSQAEQRPQTPGQPAFQQQQQQQQQQQRTALFRPAKDRMAFAADSENDVLFVRGSKDQMKEVEEIVDALDVETDKLEKKKIGNTQLIPISQQSAAQVRVTLAQLQLKHQMLQIGDAGLLVICDDGSEKQEAQAKQIEEVLSKLDAREDIGKDSDNDSRKR